MALLAWVLLGFISAVQAKLAVNYPPNAQLPPVARVSQPFNFVLSQATFGGSDLQTTYSLSNAPSWLELNSTSRTLSGTPLKEDVGSPAFDLIASDQSGSASARVTLVVTTDDGPKPGKPLGPQLQAIGPTSSPSNIIVRSGDSFSISFDKDTFTNTRPSTVYYGTSWPDNAPLPSWIRFDQSSLRFYGTTPMIGPQTFSLNLVASDVSGFSASVLSFEITVSPHILSFKQSVQTLSVTKGKEFASPEFVDTLTLDGSKPTGDLLVRTEVDAPRWLEVDKQLLSFKGTPPADENNHNVTISVQDIYQDVATLIVSLQYSQFFQGGLNECDAVIGQYFTFVFNSSLLTDDDVELDVDLGDELPWLHYNRNNKTLYGEVPSDIQPDTHAIQMTAREGSAESTRSFIINTVHEESSDRGGNASADIGGPHANKAGIIVMAIFIPLGCVGIALLLLYCRRRRQKWDSHEEDQGFEEKALPPGPTGPGLSQCQPFEGTTQGGQPTMGGEPDQESKPPKLELEPWWNANSEERNEGIPTTSGQENVFRSSMIEWDFVPSRETEQDENNPPGESVLKPNRLSFQSSPSVRRGFSNRSGRREPLKSIQPRRSLKRNSALSSRSKRGSKRSSGISTISAGLPARLSGAGHGAGGFGPPGHGFVRTSWQNAQAFELNEDSNMENLTPLFPRPPPRSRDREEHSKRMNMRTVDRDSLTISVSDSLEAFVQGRAKSRHSSNPFIAGPITRRGSSSLRALERAQSTASRTDTFNSAMDNDDYRRPDRRWSLMSGSVYTDDYRDSTYLSSLSEEPPNAPPLSIPHNVPSQSSLAQNYSRMIAPLPRFFSELSLNNAKRDGSGEASAAAADGQNWPNSRRWSRSSPSLQNWRRLRKSPSTSSIAYDAKARRVSLMRAMERDSSDQLGLRRELTGSALSDIAFV
ncbi:hypothetical protein BJX61DRAFT_538528 [Aspergillus egyptiacus]|nr:hypothetical protein BJX61DRAFT_538528 [Aspergillus egyptiacus]